MKEKLIRGVQNFVDKVNQIIIISYTPNDSVIFESLKNNFNQTCSIFICEIEGSNIDFFYNYMLYVKFYIEFFICDL